MPAVDGFGFVSRFRAIPARCDVPIIVWTVKELDTGERRRLLPVRSITPEGAHGELTRRLKADPGRRDIIIIIALTAYAMKGDDDKAFAAGCDGYLSKPIDIVDVYDAITTNRPYRATASPEHAYEELSGDVAAGARRCDMVEASIALGYSGQLAERAAAVRSGGVASTVVRQPR